MTDNQAFQRPPLGPPPYEMPANPDNASPYQTIFPPPVQGLAKAYFTPLLAPMPVATRLPQPGKTEDTINGFIRIEAAGGHLRPDTVFFDVGIIIHSYAPNNLESQAEINCMKALAVGGNAQGKYITHPSLQRPWFVSYSRISGLAVKQSDPHVNLTRFRGLLVWRIKGMPDPLNEPSPDPS